MGLFSRGNRKGRTYRGSAGHYENSALYTTYELWGMGFSRKMINTDLKDALAVRGEKWEESLWSRDKVDAYMEKPAAKLHFGAFSAYRTRTELIRDISADKASGLSWPDSIVYLICGALPEELPGDSGDTLDYILSSLKEEERDILTRRYRDGETMTSIAEKRGISPSSVSSRLKSIIYELQNGPSFLLMRIGKEKYIRTVRGEPGAMISELPMSSGKRNVLYRNNVFAVCDLQCLSKSDLLNMPHGGRKLIEELTEALRAFGCDAPFMDPFSREVKPGDFNVARELGVISEGYPGRETRLDLISWHGGEPRYDIREWSTDRKEAGQGVTLSEAEARKLYMLLSEEFAGEGATD